MRHSHLVIPALVLAAVATATGQSGKEPRRPKLVASADTNDGRSYYRFGVENLSKEPEKAADALYWAYRMGPGSAEALYARRVALLLVDGRRLVRYWSGDKRTIQSDQIRQIDSLFYRALMLNPFVSQTLERQLYEGVLNQISDEYERTHRGASSTEVRFALDMMMKDASAADRAWLAYGAGSFSDALRLYAEAIRTDRRNGPLRVDRARIFYQTGNLDSALVELTLANADLRTRDTKDLVYVYQSKALAEHSLAVIQLRRGDVQAARETFGRALQEDLSYYPAHVQLGFIALDAKDTATALTELELAVQLRDDDPVVHHIYGSTLLAAGRAADAEPQLRKAVELDPVYAAPIFDLARTLEQLGKVPDAVAQYRVFLARSAAVDGHRRVATERIEALSKAGGSGSPSPHR